MDKTILHKKIIEGRRVISKQVAWNKIILEEFISIGGLTEEEEMVMRTRVAGWTITKQALEFNMSRSKVNYIIKRLKYKYDACQKYSVILPPRKNSIQEVYMDTH